MWEYIVQSGTRTPRPICIRTHSAKIALEKPVELRSVAHSNRIPSLEYSSVGGVYEYTLSYFISIDSHETYLVLVVMRLILAGLRRMLYTWDDDWHTVSVFLLRMSGAERARCPTHTRRRARCAGIEAATTAAAAAKRTKKSPTIIHHWVLQPDTYDK